MLFLFGGRVMQEKFLFGINITSMHWLTIPLLAVADIVIVAVIALFFADRIRNPETRKKWGIVFILWLIGRDLIPYVILYGFGYNFATISDNDPFVPSRRTMTEIGTLIALSTMVVIGLIWLFRTDKSSRKRGLYMIGMTIIYMTAWTIGEWFAGQRWIEIGEEGAWNLAPPLLQFGMLTYDIVIEMGLFTVCFLALPSLLKLIKKQD
jgi:lipoprotein signal peptidase